MLHKPGCSFLSEFVTTDRRIAARLRELRSSRVVAMYHRDAIELAMNVSIAVIACPGTVRCQAINTEPVSSGTTHI